MKYRGYFALLLAAFLMSCTDDTIIGGKRSLDSNGASAVYVGDPPVLLSEVYTANPDYKDEYGSDPGWVEFYNPSSGAVALNGYCLTNDAGGDPRRWCFGNVTVPPRGYLLVFMSGRDQPHYHPPTDSINILGEAMGSWTWSDSLATPIAGGSAAYSSFTADPPKFSGTLKAVDNSAGATPWQQGLGWTSAIAMLVMKDWDTTAVLDMSRANQVFLKGFVSKDSKLEVRFSHLGVAEQHAWGAALTGTGEADGLYVIDLPEPSDGLPDFSTVYGLRFSNTSSFRGRIDFDFNSIIAHRRSSNIHVSFSLANGGGKLFLTDSEGQIRDSVAYPASTLGLSYARKIEDGVNGAWAHSKPPTPAGANSAETYEGGKIPPPPATGIPNSGHYQQPHSFTIPQGSDGAVIACDITGAMPTKDSPLKSGSTVNVTTTTVMRCAQFKDGAHPSDPIMRTYIIGRLPDLPIVSIAVDPFDMFDNTHGLYSRGPNAAAAQPHYGANFWSETELPVQIEFFESGMTPGWSHRAGLRIFGNYSRMFDKKSVVISFRDIYGQGRLNYRLFPELSSQTRYKHFILRNNGNNYQHDYIRDMLMTSLTEGLGIDYQRGRATVVYYNGEYFGIHNLRERANGDYFETKYGDSYAQEYIDLVKAAGEVSEGSDNDYKNIISWLESLNGLSDDNLKTLDQRIDTDNFTYNFMCRMYYKDRDWPSNNMKRWRTHSPPSRWKWLMYDTDHGWGYPWGHEPNTSTMAFVTATNGPDWPNPPYSTFLFRKLLENDGYKRSFINRFSLLMATYFSSNRVNARIDALMAPIQSEIQYDQARYGHDPDDMYGMNSQMNTIRSFNDSRRTQMQNEVAQFFNLGGGVDLTLSVTGSLSGKILVHNMEVMNGSATFKAYSAAPIALKAVSVNGAVFESWSDGNTNAERVFTVSGGQPVTLQAIFKDGTISVLERERVIPEMYR